MLTHTDLKAREQKRSDYLSTLTVTKGSAYSSGNILGGLVTIDTVAGTQGPIEENGLSRVLQSISVVDTDSQSAAVDLFFFNQKPATAMVDKTVFAPSAADLQNCIGVISVAQADFLSAGASGTIAAGLKQTSLGRVLKPFGGTALYCVPVVRGTPTYTIGQVYVRFQFV